MQTGLHCEEWEPVEEHATRTYQTWGFLDALACTEIHFVPGSSKMNLTHTHTHTHPNFASESSWQLHKKSDLQHLLKNAWAWNAKIATGFTTRTMASDTAKKTVIRRACLGRYRPSLSQSSMLSIQEQLVNEMLANHERREWHKNIGNTYTVVCIEGNDRQTGKEDRLYNVRLRSVYPKSKHPQQPCLTLARCSSWITSALAANDNTDEMKHSQSQQRRQNSTKGLHHLLPESSNCKPLRRSWQVFWREQWGQSIS